MGPLREHKARADFSRGFFAAGGYEVISPPGFTTPEDAALAFAESGRPDRGDLFHRRELSGAGAAAGAGASARRSPDAIIVLAGYPQDQIEAHKKAGVDEFIHVRADAVELLGKFHRQLGIES